MVILLSSKFNNVSDYSYQEQADFGISQEITCVKDISGPRRRTGSLTPSETFSIFCFVPHKILEESLAEWDPYPFLTPARNV
jgi:hypothetical protein